MLPDELPHSCTIQRSAWVQDDLAADADMPDTLQDDDTYSQEADEQEIPCWVQPASKTEISRFQRREQNVTHTVYFRENLSLKPGHIVLPNNNGRLACPFNGATLEVKAASETTAGLGVLYAAVCEEVQDR